MHNSQNSSVQSYPSREIQFQYSYSLDQDAELSLSRKNIDHLKRNYNLFSVKKLASIYSNKQDRVSDRKASSKQIKDNSMFCWTCKQVLPCIQDYLKGKHCTHRVDSLKDSQVSIKEVLIKKFQKGMTILNYLQQKQSQILNSEYPNLDKRYRQVKYQISSSFDRQIKILMKKSQQMIEQVTNRYHKIKSQIESEQKVVKNVKDKTNQICQDIVKALQQNSRKYLRIFKQLHSRDDLDIDKWRVRKQFGQLPAFKNEQNLTKYIQNCFYFVQSKNLTQVVQEIKQGEQILNNAELKISCTDSRKARSKRNIFQKGLLGNFEEHTYKVRLTTKMRNYFTAE